MLSDNQLAVIKKDCDSWRGPLDDIDVHHKLGMAIAYICLLLDHIAEGTK
jgi:hypothetical protein